MNPTASEAGPARGATRAAAAVPGAAVLLAGGFLVLVALHIAIARGIEAPFTYHDEQGYLAIARYLAGMDAVAQISALPFYHAGYALLLAPLYVLLDEPLQVYHGVIAVNAVVASLGALPLFALGRELLGLTRARAALVAIAVTAYPAYLVMANGAWADVLFVPLFSLFLLAVLRAVGRGTLAAAVGTGLAGAGLYATHPRGIVLGPLGGLALAWCARGGLLPARRAAAGIAVLAAGTAAAMLLHARLVDRIWAGDPSSPSASGLALRLVSPAHWGDIAVRLAGQAGYLALASLGLWGLGILLLARMAVRPDGAAREDRARRITAAVAVIAVAAVMVITAGTFAADPIDGRLDTLLYGRYTEGVSAVVLAAGLAGLLRASAARPLLVRWAAVLAAGCACLLPAYLAAGAEAFRSAFVIPLNIIGAIWFAGAGTESFGFALWRFAGLAVVTALAVALVWRWRPVAAVALAGLLFAVSGTMASRQYYVPGTAFVRELLTLQHAVPPAAAGAPIGYDLATFDLAAYSGYQFWLDRHQFVMFDSRAGRLPETPLVIASPGWAGGPAAGGRVAAVDPGGASALWVMPGPLLDGLTAEGRVLPGGPGALLPPDAARGRLQPVNPPQQPLRLAPGGRREMRLQVGHAGAGAPWLQASAGAGGVAVLAAWYGADGGAVRGQQAADLPRTLGPGDVAEVALVLRASDPEGRPLPPGRYRVQIALAQLAGPILDLGPDGAVLLDVIVG